MSVLIARRSFTTDYDGERIAIIGGRTRVDESHELARRYPHSFEPMSVRDEVGWRFRDRLAEASDPAELEQMIAAFSQLFEASERRGVERGPLPLEVRH